MDYTSTLSVKQAIAFDGETPYIKDPKNKNGFRTVPIPDMIFPIISIKHIATLLGDTEKMVIEVCNHMILEKEDIVSALDNALNF